jgi:hypothetical protein
MTGPAGHVGTVVPLRRSRSSQGGRSHEPGLDMAGAARSFDLVERCARRLQPGRLAIAGNGEGFDRPIVIFQVELPVVEQWLDRLGRIDPAHWHDTRWVLRLSEARAAAALRLHAVTKSLHRCPPGTGTLDDRLAADIGKFADSLHRLRDLIAQQYPETLRAP